MGLVKLVDVGVVVVAGVASGFVIVVSLDLATMDFCVVAGGLAAVTATGAAGCMGGLVARAERFVLTLR